MGSKGNVTPTLVLYEMRQTYVPSGGMARILVAVPHNRANNHWLLLSERKDLTRLND